jgi:hypothetical protein
MGKAMLIVMRRAIEWAIGDNPPNRALKMVSRKEY